ncbi:MAG: tetratricopeptide repeat protein [Peptococcaceae bacterium]|jgi:Flp pilus assembly protein TadD|nr:tetratricopeptide repeat protein [Peptococcaceae bacterium]
MNNLIGSLIKNKSLRESSSFLHKLRYIPYNLETTSKSKNRFETSENEDLGDCRSLKDVNELINCGAYQEAKNYLEKINIESSHETDLKATVLYLLARSYYGLGLLNETLVYLDKAIAYQLYDINILKLKADCLLELGRSQEAIQTLNKLLRLAPTDAETLYRLGSIYVFYGEYEDALMCFNGCCKLRPNNSHYWEMKAEMLIKLNKLDEACLSYKKALRLGGRPHIISRLAYCYAIKGNISKAQKLLNKALKIEPDNYDALCNLAAIYHKLNKNDQAYKLFNKAYNLNQNDPILLNNLGYVCFKLGRTRKAIEYYNQALDIEPSNITVLYNLSICFLAKGQLEEACKTLEKLISLDSENSSFWVLLGNTYEQLSRHRIAVDCFNKSLKLAR